MSGAFEGGASAPLCKCAILHTRICLSLIVLMKAGGFHEKIGRLHAVSRTWWIQFSRTDRREGVTLTVTDVKTD